MPTPKKIVVPEGMRVAVAHALFNKFGSTDYHPRIRIALEEACSWLSENPIVPTERQFQDMEDEHARPNCRWMVIEWQRRMFADPISVPEAMVKAVAKENMPYLKANKGSDFFMLSVLESALRWLSENPSDDTPAPPQ